jgi:hypothetical protein
MANNYLQFSCVLEGLTGEEQEWTKKRLKELGEPDFPDDEPKADFEWKIDADGDLHMFAEESGEPNDVANFVQAFLKKFRPAQHFSMTWCTFCDKMRVDEFSGGGVLVTAEKQQWFVPEDLIRKAIDEEKT